MVNLTQNQVFNRPESKMLDMGKPLKRKQHSHDHKKTYMSLLSQSKNQINIEVVADPNIDEYHEDENLTSSLNSMIKIKSSNKAKRTNSIVNNSITRTLTKRVMGMKPKSTQTCGSCSLHAQLEQFICISNREDH